MFEYPKRLFNQCGSRMGIFFVKRRLKKTPQALGMWILLARLYEVRHESSTAVQTLEHALTLFPENPLLKQHLYRMKER